MSRLGWIPLICLIALGSAAAGCRGTASRIEPRLATPAPEPSTTAVASPRRLPPVPPPAEKAEEVVLASHQELLDELELPQAGDPAELAPAELVPRPETLELHEVMLSVRQAYPLLRSAELERQVADGVELGAWGAFDTQVKAFGIAAPQGYYKNYRNGVVLEQPVFSGGYLLGGYKIGDGDFQPWYGERETNEGGEFAAGVGIPLLQNRTIDKRREALAVAELSRQTVDASVQAQYLDFTRLAAHAYWYWVAAGKAVAAQRELLVLAEDRVKQIQERIKAGDLGPIYRINNDQLIAARETKVIEAERKLQATAIKLSLFLRNEAGEPIIPDPAWRPADFPEYSRPDPALLNSDIARALDARPELVELRLRAEQVRVELAQAENQMLPKLDAQFLAAQDVGGDTGPYGNKSPFELEAGLYGEVPLQRREARGKITSSRGKLAQIAAKREFVVNKVTALVQDAVSAMDAAAERMERAQTNLRLANEARDLAELQFRAGDLDLVELNIYEQTATDAQLLLIAAQADFLVALANYRAALSIDPLTTED